MTSFEKAVIISLYRQGNSYEVIGGLMGVHFDVVERIIKEYLKNSNELWLK